MILAVLAFIFGGLGIAILFKKKIEQTIIVYILLAITLLYLFSLAGILQWGVYFVFVLSTCGLIFSAIHLTKQILARTFKFQLRFGLLFYFMLIVIAWWAHRGRVLTSYDEFTHWGLAVKDLYYSNMLPNHSGTMVSFMDYPPSIALLQYFFMQCQGAFVESSLFSAINVLYFSAMLPAFGTQKTKGFFRSGVIFLLVLMAPLILFQNFYIEIYIDAILGVVFGYILVSYFTHKRDIFQLINLSLSLFVLALIKKSGTSLAIIALLIMVVDMIFFKKEYWQKDGRFSFKHLLMSLIPILALAVASTSWKIYTHIAFATGNYYQATLPYKSILMFLTGHRDSTQNTIIGNFITMFFQEADTGFNMVISMLGIVALFVLIAFLYTRFFTKKPHRKRLTVFLVSILGGFLLYAFGLMVLYLFGFSTYEANMLARHARYLGTYLMAIIVLLVSVMGVYAAEKKGKKEALTLLMLFLGVILNLNPILGITFMSSASVKEGVDKMNSLTSITSMREYVSKDDAIYFINPGGSGYYYHVSRYYMMPYVVGSEPWSIGPENYSDEVFTRDVSPEAWEKKLYDEYQYVYVYETNDKFLNTYGHLFENQQISDETAYYIEKSEGRILLKPVH